MPKISRRPSYEPKVEHSDFSLISFFFLKLSYEAVEDI